MLAACGIGVPANGLTHPQGNVNGSPLGAEQPAADEVPARRDAFAGRHVVAGGHIAAFAQLNAFLKPCSQVCGGASDKAGTAQGEAFGGMLRRNATGVARGLGESRSYPSNQKSVACAEEAIVIRS